MSEIVEKESYFDKLLEDTVDEIIKVSDNVKRYEGMNFSDHREELKEALKQLLIKIESYEQPPTLL